MSAQVKLSLMSSMPSGQAQVVLGDWAETCEGEKLCFTEAN